MDLREIFRCLRNISQRVCVLLLYICNIICLSAIRKHVSMSACRFNWLGIVLIKCNCLHLVSENISLGALDVGVKFAICSLWYYIIIIFYYHKKFDCPYRPDLWWLLFNWFKILKTHALFFIETYYYCEFPFLKIFIVPVHAQILRPVPFI